MRKNGGMTPQAFQSTPLMRGETFQNQAPPQNRIHFNPLPSCEGRRKTAVDADAFIGISIHSPHARGDRPFHKELYNLHNFNPLPSCEGRPAGTIPSLPISKFQSTPLMRGETTTGYVDVAKIPISIHSPHARGDLPARVLSLSTRIISIHSPHARGDNQHPTIPAV